MTYFCLFIFYRLIVSCKSDTIWRNFATLAASLLAIATSNFFLASVKRLRRSAIITDFDGRERNNFDVPAALAGFRTYRWEVIATSTPKIVVNSIYQVYCKANGAICPAIDNSPSVGEGQISPAPCPEGYTGYSYRVCSGGKLGEILLDKCADTAKRCKALVFVNALSFEADGYRNTTYVFDRNGELCGKYFKKHLPRHCGRHNRMVAHKQYGAYDSCKRFYGY